jgi:hypothetical protein
MSGKRALESSVADQSGPSKRHRQDEPRQDASMPNTTQRLAGWEPREPTAVPCMLAEELDNRLEMFRVEGHNDLYGRVSKLEKSGRSFDQFDTVKNRVTRLENWSRSHEMQVKQTPRRNTQLMQDEQTAAHHDALDAIEKVAEDAKAEYSRHVSGIALKCVFLSTNKLAATLISRLEDEDELKPEYLEKLRELLLPATNAVTKAAANATSNVDAAENAASIDEENVASSSQTALAFNPTPELDATTAGGVEDGGHAETMENPPRRSSRASKPTSRQKDFVNLKDAKTQTRRRGARG